MPPVFSHGDLRLYLLNLLAAAPRHGYDIMQSLAERTGGTYTPSAGTIYPRLSKLEEEGLVTKTSDGRKTVYEITDAGRAEVSSRADEIAGIEAGLADTVRAIADEVRSNVREAMKSLRADLAAAAHETPRTTPFAPNPAEDDQRVRARAELHRAETAIADFRGRVRSELRGHVAKGGDLLPATVDAFAAALEAAAASLSASLRR